MSKNIFQDKALVEILKLRLKRTDVRIDILLFLVIFFEIEKN